MKFKNAIVFALAALSAASASGAEKLKFAFLSPDARNQANSAIFNGARDALSELSKKYAADMSLEFFSADRSAERQLSELSKAYLDGFAGALVVPADPAVLEGKVAELAKSGFFVASAGARLKGAAYFCGTDSKAAAELAKREIARLSGSSKPANYCYFPAFGGTSGAAGKCLSSPVPEEEARSLFESAESAAISSYSDYASERAVDIMRRDNYGEIFFDARLLSNMVPIKPDSDRVFAVCLGSLPQLDFYLSSGQLDSCIYDDWYGWGYFAMRALAEKVVEKRDPPEPEKLLKPLSATPKNVPSFRADWAKWLR